MAWIKRNLIFVISVAVGLIATGFCGYLLYTSLNDNSAVNDDYQSNLANLQGMEQKSPYPSKQNIEAATADEARIRQFLVEFRKSFSPFPTPPAKDDKGFKVYLEDSLVRFRAEATNSEVGLPPEYGFSFGGLVNKLNYAPADIAAWMIQIQEISTILDILYKAKVNYISALCRVPISPDDTGAGDCLIQATIVTNKWGIETPYKITFRGFSTEIAAVLEGFARASNCFIIKSVDVAADTTVSEQVTQAPEMNRPAPMQVFVPQAPRPMPGLDRGERGRFPGARPFTPPVAQRPVASPTAAVSAEPPVIILTESPLTVTVAVDAVKLKISEH